MSEYANPRTSGELLDVVDQFGDPSGQVTDKQTIHQRGLRHRDVHVWVTNGQDLLQQQRTWDKSIMPGAWDISVGGHVGAGETYLDASQRETGEELGLWRPAERFKRIGLVATRLSLPGWERPHNIVGDNFVLYEPDLELRDLELQEEEVLGARWYPIDRLERDMMDAETVQRHAPQPAILYALGIAGMRGMTAS